MQQANVPLLSLLIPTKDRYGTLVAVVDDLLRRIDDPRLEVVICDNSSVRESEAIERMAGDDPRISYHYVDGDISIVDNVERGISLCRGDYLCFIGDDDFVSPHVMEVIDWLKAQSEDCLIYTPARYWWSGVRFAKTTRYQRPGAFWLPKNRAGSIRRFEAQAEVKNVLARGGVAYMNLPRLYHGIVSRRAVQRVRDRFGKVVPGSSPDMALCMALALTNDSYLSIDYPVSVFGASRNSGGGLTAARKHYGRIQDQKHMPRDMMNNWDPWLPQIFSEQIIYPQTIHEVMSIAGVDGKVSYPTLYGSLIAYEPHIFAYLWPVMLKYALNRPAEIARIISKTVLKIAGRARTAVRSGTGLGMPFDLHIFLDIGELMDFMGSLSSPDLPTVTSPDRSTDEV